MWYMYLYFILEANCLLNTFKRIFCRLDNDQCARKNAQKFFDVVDPDYYEFEGKK